MKTHAWVAILLGLGPFAAGCWTDRPLYEATTPDAAAPAGAAGVTGQQTGSGGGGSAAAGTTGSAGTGGGVPLGCDQAVAILQSRSCGIDGSCHGRPEAGTAAGFSLEELSYGNQAAATDWRRKFVGVYPKGGGPGAITSMCFPSQVPYLVPGSAPATGLLLDKLFDDAPPCGARMPLIGSPLTNAEQDCLQRWANALTAP